MFVEVTEGMSLAANFKVMTLAKNLTDAGLEGIVDIWPANASLLVRFDPDVLPPSTLESTVRGIERELTRQGELSLETRIIEVPVWYDDPLTAEVAQRFREGFHQEREGTDLASEAAPNDRNRPLTCGFAERH